MRALFLENGSGAGVNLSCGCRTICRGRCPRAGWKLIAPGTYVDAKQVMHIVEDELLAAWGYADTPANRAVLREAAEHMAEEWAAEFRLMN